MSAATSLPAGLSPPSSPPGVKQGPRRGRAQSAAIIIWYFLGNDGVLGARCQGRARGPRRQARGWAGKESPNGSRLTLGPSQQRDLVCETLKPRKGRSPLPVWSWLLRGMDVTGPQNRGKSKLSGSADPGAILDRLRALTAHACTGHAASAHRNVTDPKQPAHQCVEDTQTRLPPARPTCSKRQGNGANGPSTAGWH